MKKGVKAITFLLSPFAGVAFLIGVIITVRGAFNNKPDVYDKHRFKSKFK